MFGQIQTSQTGGQQYSDTSPYIVRKYSLHQASNSLDFHGGILKPLWPELAKFKSFWQFLDSLFGKILNLHWQMLRENFRWPNIKK